MDLKEVQEFFKASGDDSGVKAYRETLAKESITEDVVRGYLETDAGKKLVRSGSYAPVEVRVADALKTYRETHYEQELKAAIAVEREKLNPKETEAEKRIRELEEKDLKRERELAREKLMRSITEEAASAKVPTSLFKHFGGDSIEAAREIIADFQAVAKDIETKAKNGIVTSGVTPKSGDTPKGPGIPVGTSLQDLEKSIREGAMRS